MDRRERDWKWDHVRQWILQWLLKPCIRVASVFRFAVCNYRSGREPWVENSSSPSSEVQGSANPTSSVHHLNIEVVNLSEFYNTGGFLYTVPIKPELRLLLAIMLRLLLAIIKVFHYIVMPQTWWLNVATFWYLLRYLIMLFTNFTVTAVWGDGINQVSEPLSIKY